MPGSFFSAMTASGAGVVCLPGVLVRFTFPNILGEVFLAAPPPGLDAGSLPDSGDWMV